MTARAAVLGSPVRHSLSPVIHRAAYAHLGLDWSYEPIELRPEEFAGFVNGLDDSWRGLSVTMPLKEEAARCGAPDADVVLTEAANTVTFGDLRRVYNTDIAGLNDALDAAGVGLPATVTVLGNGATARSALVTLARRGTGLVGVQGRSPDRVEQFRHWAEQLEPEVQPRTWGAPLDPATELLISTVPGGVADDILDTLAVDVCPALRAVVDVTYDPWPTALAAAAQAAGLIVVNGVDLLVHQAVHQIRLMTGREVPAELLLSAVREGLTRRDHT